MLAAVSDREEPGASGARVPRMTVGLLRAVDADAWGHVYSIGSWPDGELVGELGAVRKRNLRDTEPIWITERGRVVTSSQPATATRPSVRVRMRWILAPLGWRGSAKLRARLQLARQRRK